MPRQWGATRAYVRELNQIPTGANFSYNGRQYLTNVVPDTAIWNRRISQIGDGAARFYPTQDWEMFLVPGRVLVVEQPVSGYPQFLVRTITCFLIEEVEPASSGEVFVRGPGVESLITRRPRFKPVGEERVFATAIAPQNQTPAMTTLNGGVPPGNGSAILTDAAGFDVNDQLRIRRGDNNDGDWHVATITNKAGNTINFTPAMVGQAASGNDVQAWPGSGGTGAHAPITTTLTAGAPHGMDAAILATTTGIVVGDEVRIRTGEGDSGPWFSAAVRSVNPSGAPYPNTIQFVPDLTADAPVGNSVEIRAGRLRVYDTNGLAEGQRVVVALNGGGETETIITEINGDEKWITILAGLTAAANIGNGVTAYDYGARTTADVTQVMETAPDWGVSFQAGNGSAMGTAFTPKGESVFDILLSISERTGEFFRYTLLASGLPTKQLEWRRTPDSSGVTLILYDTDEYARQRSHELDATKGSVFSVRRKVARPLITRIYPSAGDQAITLASCSAEALLYAAVMGCAVHISTDFYEPDYVEYTSGVLDPKIGVQAIRQTYGDISIDDATNAAQLGAACDQLLLSAVNELTQSQLRTYYTIEAFVPVALKPGQTVKIENATRVEPTVSATTDYVVLEVSERQVDGRPRTTLTVSNMLGLRRTPANTLGAILRTATQSIRRVAGAGGSGVSVSIAGGGTVGEHVHPQYLPVAGGVPLAGNMPVADGVLIDGVDISVHVANPDAHHARVSLLDSGLRQTGQALGLRLSPVSPALMIRSNAGQEGLAVLLQSPSGLEATASGLALADSVAGEGLKVVGKVLHVDLGAPSGLLISGDKLAMAMADSDLSATTVNEVRSLGHKHRIITTSDGQTTPATILAANGAGTLRLTGLAIGAPWGSSEALLVQPAYGSQTAARFKAAASQTAPLWRVENSAGQAMILLAADGALESGSPAFVSGMTGWQIAPATAEFNDVFIRGELHATTFVADEMHATGGTLAVMTATRVAPPVAASDNRMPATGAAFVLNVDASWDTGFCYLVAGDVARIKTMSQTGGGLDLFDVWLTVDSVGALTGRNLNDGNPGYYPVTATRRSGGATNMLIPAGSAVVRWGRTGQAAGAFTGGLILTADLNQSPYIDIFTVPADATPTAWGNPQGAATLSKSRVRVGNLDGVLGLTEQWGLAAGTNLSDSSVAARYIVASDRQVRLNNVDQSVYRGAVEVIRLNSGAEGGEPFIGVGSPLPSGPATGGPGFWAGISGGVGQVRVGATAGGAQLLYDGTALTLASGLTGGRIVLNPATQSIALGNPLPTGVSGGGAGIWMGLEGGAYQMRIGNAAGAGVRWTGTALELRNAANAAAIRAGNSGDVDIAGVLTVGQDGGIWQGTGSFGSPMRGLKLYSLNGYARLAGFNEGVIQTALDTDGAFKAGWDGSVWNTVMNRNGVAMTAGEIANEGSYVGDTVKRLTWNQGGSPVSWVSGRYVAGSGVVGIEIMAGSTIPQAGARFNYRAGGAEASTIFAQGELRLIVGSRVQVQGGLDVFNGEATFGQSVTATASVYASKGVVIGGQPLGQAHNAPGLLTMYPRAHPSNPAPSTVVFYVYHNTGTGKYELTMRNAAGATVKVAEVAAA